eukprot:CAMPEP_0194160210 /NCGR_PEP_ID=MMETSP0152-20130528/78266_1 /TAXON_ID=1049557 /ORGANISM="Thalassiothrix antarctica, Strain L6-D1" /LENGTH=46 /DNA_ID= /DNA_START= /DNA_END= /DNA_ORIENTATION=
MINAKSILEDAIRTRRVNANLDSGNEDTNNNDNKIDNNENTTNYDK